MFSLDPPLLNKLVAAACFALVPLIWWFVYRAELKKTFVIQPSGSSTGFCDCCGANTRGAWGFVHTAHDVPAAAYWAYWTDKDLREHVANLDLVIGPWGENTNAAQRIAVSLEYWIFDDVPQFAVIDSGGRPAADGTLASRALRREDVIGTRLAKKVFRLVDAVYEQDCRVFAQ